eukprot:15436507-Alexandrium_andersonii.AAC.1
MNNGTGKADLEALASLGSSGKYSNHCHGDLVRKLHHPPWLQRVQHIGVPLKKLGKTVCGVFQQCMLLPHVLFSLLFQHYPDAFQARVCPSKEKLREFWRQMEGHPQLDNHPVKAVPGYATKAIPISIHGDAVPVTGVGKRWHKSMTFYTWASMVGSGSTKEMMFYIFAAFTHLLNKGQATSSSSSSTVWKVMVWSFSWMAKGMWPDRDHLGKKFSPESWEGRLALTPLAGG